MITTLTVRSRARRPLPTRTSPSLCAENAFPVFAQHGDAQILIASTDGHRQRRYVLHWHVLAQHSGYLRSVLSAQMASGCPHPSGHFALDWSTATNETPPMLVWHDNPIIPTLTSSKVDELPPPISTGSKPHMDKSFRSRAMAGHSSSTRHHQLPAAVDADQDMFTDYDNLFRAFYNLNPKLDDDNLATAYTECKALLHLANLYDALDVVGPRVDLHLLRFGSRLLHQIAKYPASYLKLSVSAKSKVIFKEALIHVVGQWPRARAHLREQVSPAVLDTIQDKYDELEHMRRTCEASLFRLGCTDRSAHDTSSPANDFLGWLATSLFRQWLVDNLPQRRPSQSKHCGKTNSSPKQLSSDAAFCLINADDMQGYLSRDEQKEFLERSALQSLCTSDSIRRFERKVKELKDLARTCVKPLMHQELQLGLACSGSGDEVTERAGSGVSMKPVHLTCVKVDDQDIPWKD